MKTTTDKNQNPLICDLEKGVCEHNKIEGNAHPIVENKENIVKVIYFTDPICSSCWGIEPQLRRLKLEYKAAIEIEYHMGGLLPSWDIYSSGGISKPSDVSHHWDEVSNYYEMPIDGDIWLEDPLSSSYPPSIAFKAAQMQDKEKAVLFLRKIREMVFLEKKNITKWNYLQQAAVESGLDPSRFKKDYEGDAQDLFKKDLELAAKMKVRGFPTLIFSNKSGASAILYGYRPYEQFESGIEQVSDTHQKLPLPGSLEELFNQYSTLTAKEVAVILGIPKQDALTALLKMKSEKKVEERVYKNGSLWVKN